MQVLPKGIAYEWPRAWLQKLPSLAVIISAWTAAALWIENSKLLPSPLFIATQSLPDIARFGGFESSIPAALGVIGRHAFYTIFNIMTGITTGTSAGLLIGLGVHFFYRSRRSNALLLSIIKAVPLFALLPLFLFWFGGRQIGVFVYIAFCVLVVVSTNTYEAACNVPPSYIHQARLLGANRIRVFTDVYIPAIGPEMIGSLRSVAGLSWAFSLGAEYLTGNSGLGYLVYQSYLYADMGKLLVFILIYGILGTLSVVAIRPFSEFLRKWAD